MGQMHQTAYRYFRRMLALLQNPEEGAGWALTDVMREYMQMHVPQQPKKNRNANARSAGTLDVLQKMVRLYWPGETSLSRMQTQAEDVSRKALLLLYLATEAFEGGAEDDTDVWLYEDLADDPDAMLEVRIEETNFFLQACGMNLLDPGNPFDLLLLYAMKTEEDEEARLRMEEVLEILFAEE